MGLFDFVSGTRKPDPSVPVRPPADVYQAILAINRPTAPFVIHPGTDQGVDLIAEWRIVDAQWYQIFAKAGLTKVFKILMRLDPAAAEVRAVDQEWEVSWVAGVPHTRIRVSASRGQQIGKEFGRGYAFTEQLQFGQVYNYRFDTSEIKDPIRDVVVEHGWTYRGVTFGKL